MFLAPGGENNATDTPAAVASIGGGLASTPEVELPGGDIFETPAEQITDEPESAPPPTATPTQPIVNTTPFLYYTQAGQIHLKKLAKQLTKLKKKNLRKN